MFVKSADTAARAFAARLPVAVRFVTVVLASVLEPLAVTFENEPVPPVIAEPAIFWPVRFPTVVEPKVEDEVV